MLARLARTLATSRMTKTAAPWGAWPSPVTTDLVLSSAVVLAEPMVGPNRTLAWLEGRPEEKGRNALVVQSAQGTHEQVLPDAKWNARSRCAPSLAYSHSSRSSHTPVHRVHEYGGGAWTFENDGSIIFDAVEGPAYRVKRRDDGTWSEPEQITPRSSTCSLTTLPCTPAQSSPSPGAAPAHLLTSHLCRIVREPLCRLRSASCSARHHPRRARGSHQ